ncbi:hypothetical protein BDZ89DRAFT_1058143 [Hymenopellis radicata]|nr:hypothetical protein BDZ89DRAFT_1058143 [Hymenopellis radicata]
MRTRPRLCASEERRFFPPLEEQRFEGIDIKRQPKTEVSDSSAGQVTGDVGHVPSNPWEIRTKKSIWSPHKGTTRPRFMHVIAFLFDRCGSGLHLIGFVQLHNQG